MLNSKDVITSSGIEFGTSGARGLVTDFTPEVCQAFTHSFVKVMRNHFTFTKVGIAIDRRPSSYAMAMQCAAALQQLGLEPIYSGVIPTPALAYSTMQASIPAVMVTGSHIPFDRNGLKFYRPDGEISKEDETSILGTPAQFEFSDNSPALEVDLSATELYLERYKLIVQSDALKGKHIAIYEHSSAGRDVYADLFRSLGAQVTSLGRSEEFVPIDTEAVSEADRQQAKQWAQKYKLDAIFSTDGDGDRPLIADENGDWLRGDILGLLCAKLLNIEALSVPINCNTAIELCGAFKNVRRTKIGSPYVIAEFPRLAIEYDTVAGFEANGGFILTSDLNLDGKDLKALPTRDALLPAIVLLSNPEKHTLSKLTKTLPARYTASDRVTDYSQKQSKELIDKLIVDPCKELARLGIESTYTSIDHTDGCRIFLDSEDIVHFRPSGNAPELRIYSESDSNDKAIEIIRKTKQILHKT